MKSIAIMQPYFFPYIGYYQLFSAVDTFVFLDDVSFRKKSYINRNSLNHNNREFKFSLSVSKMSQNRLINKHEYIDPCEQTILFCNHVYNKKDLVFDYKEFLKEQIFFDDQKNVAIINQRTITATMNSLGIDKEVLRSSSIPRKLGEKGQQRIIAICEYLQADRYINLPGGKSLYSHESFNTVGIDLKFIENQLSPPFYSYLDHFLLKATEDQVAELHSYRLID